MTVTRQIGTGAIYLVESARLNCSKFECGWSSIANKWADGDECPDCISRGAANIGKLEYRLYQVDLTANKAIGQCGCEDFEIRKNPQIKLLNVDTLEAFAKDEHRCRHILAARAFAKEDENLDALLMALPRQMQ